MQAQEQLAVAQRLLNLIDTDSNERVDDIFLQPVTDYTSADIAARERAELFASTPLCVGLSDDLSGPGTFRTHDLSGVPILLTRDGAGTFRAFLNVCRHRGARLANGAGTSRGFTCPYHAWGFALDGALVTRPDDASFTACPRGDYGLTPLPCAERDGLLWVCTTPRTPLDLDTFLGKLGPELSSYQLGGFKYYASRTLTRRMNWKLVVDTFLESYHFCVLHRDSICSIFYHNIATFDAYSQHLRLVSPRKSIQTLAPLPSDGVQLLPHIVVIYILFPNTVLVWQGEQIELWQIYPGASVDESTLQVTLYSPEPALTEKAKRHWDRNLDLVLHVVENEDFPVGEGIQKGFYSQAQTHTVFGRNEPALAHYHRELRAAVGAPPA